MGHRDRDRDSRAKWRKIKKMHMKKCLERRMRSRRATPTLKLKRIIQLKDDCLLVIDDLLKDKDRYVKERYDYLLDLKVGFCLNCVYHLPGLSQGMQGEC